MYEYYVTVERDEKGGQWLMTGNSKKNWSSSKKEGEGVGLTIPKTVWRNFQTIPDD